MHNFTLRAYMRVLCALLVGAFHCELVSRRNTKAHIHAKFS